MEVHLDQCDDEGAAVFSWSGVPRLRNDWGASPEGGVSRRDGALQAMTGSEWDNQQALTQIMAKTTESLNLSFLLDHEREVILRVLQKDEKLRKLEEKRIRKLKNELLEMKRKGPRRPHEAGERQCSRCQKTLGLIFERGEECEDCRQRVCTECRVPLAKGRWRCSVCTKILELKVLTGEWFLEERSKRFSHGTAVCSDVVKQSILSSPPGSEPPASRWVTAARRRERFIPATMKY
ncbi:hypothetical protein Z043_113987 [Scleropages formosus]|uniref:RabBD domain-containing protein n=1 Tax=Scleropages formosus TaxID=113540 RepID=A0A0P7UGT5_SCLFO|nr:hypothetical protein Z043_113987 [Scleropages formosus]